MGTWPTVAELAEQIKAGKTSAVESVRKSLNAINTHSEYQAIISTIEGRAMQRAGAIDQQIAQGNKVGKLAGVPFIAKDNFLTFGSETTAASNILKGFVAPYQATAIERLEAEGAICVAKANLDAFGHGGSTENSDFFPTKNPHDKTRVPGGSSGGPAAAVILDMAPFAIGTDTGGSNRQPAAFVGAVGYKPTYGLVSRSGVVAMASSTDTIGPIGRNIQDVALILDVISGSDPLDSTTIERDSISYVPMGLTQSSIRVGMVEEFMGSGLDDNVRHMIERSAQLFKDNGVELKSVNIPSLPLALACYYILVPAEISSNLSRYDGQRYGYSSEEAQSLDESYEQSRSIGFGDEAKRRIMIGTYVLSSGYYDAYYKKAQQLRTKLIQEFSKVFGEVDVLMGPTAPTTAFESGKLSNDPLQMYLQDIYTVPPSLVGSPALSMPCGKDSRNLPVGLQLIGRQGADRQLLEFAAFAEGILR